MKTLLLSLFTLLFVVACSDTLQQSGSQSKSEPHILTIKVRPLVESQTYQLNVHYIGRVEAGRSSHLGFDLGGELVLVNVQEGDTVTADQPLAQLAIERLNAVENQALAQLKQARAQVKLSKSTWDRTLGAYEFEAVSVQQRDEAEQAFDQALASLALTRAQLQRVKVDIWQSTLKAPYNGTIIKRFTDEGEIVSPAQPVLHIQENAVRKVRIGVSSDQKAQWVIGSQHILEIAGKPVAAKLSAIIPTLNPVTKTTDLVFSIESDRTIEPGTLARLTYQKQIEQRGFWAPLSVLTEGNRGLWTLLIAIAEEGNLYRLEQRVIDILHQQGEQIYVKGALTGDELLVIEGIHRVVPGQSVYIIKD